jgi:hypothetical protein
MLGFTGYHGGFDALQRNNLFPSSVLQRKAQKKGILHVGGPYNKEHQQFNYTKFVHPIMKQAVMNGAQKLLYLVTESSQGSHKYLPNSAMLGTYGDVVDYVCEYTRSKPHVGVYYYQKDPSVQDIPSPVRVFLDIDANIDHEAGDPFTIAYTDVQKAIDILNDTLGMMCEDIDAFPLDYSICYNERQTGQHTTKCSFHVTWHHHAFESQQQQRDFVTDTLKDKVKYVDFKVYTNGRLMRAPFTGKNGDRVAMLKPVDSVNFDAVTGKWTYKLKDCDRLTPAIFHDFNITPYEWEKEKYIFHSYKKTTNDKRDRVRVIGGRAGNDTGPDDADIDTVVSEHMMGFFRPIMIDVIVRKIQEHRHSLLRARNSRDMRAGVPTTVYSVTTPKLGWRTGCYSFKVEGDTFCEHDIDGTTPYYHENTTKTKIQINLRAGYYTQLCYTCANAKQTKWSLFGPSCISISPYKEESSFRTLELAKEDSAAFYLQYWRDDVIYNPSISPDFFVYHTPTKTWRNIEQTLHTKRFELRLAYISYRLAWFEDEVNFRMVKLDERIDAGDASPDDRKKAQNNAKKERTRLQNLQPFHTEPTKFVKSIQAAYEFNAGSGDCEMDIFPHLVPLKNGECYDVLGDCIVAVRKDMRISSCLNASMCMVMDEDCRAIKDWFLEVSKGRRDMATYLKRIVGLCMTRLKVDRKFYCNLGKEGRNGKSVLFEILQVERMAHLYARFECSMLTSPNTFLGSI